MLQLQATNISHEKFSFKELRNMSKKKVVLKSNKREELDEFNLSVEHNIYTRRNTRVIAQERIVLGKRYTVIRQLTSIMRYFSPSGISHSQSTENHVKLTLA